MVEPVKGTVRKDYEGRNTVYTFLVVITAALTGLLLGYDNGIMGGVVTMRDFQDKFFPSVANHGDGETGGASDPYCKYNDHMLELVVSCLYLAAIVGALGSEVTSRKYGRRVTMVISGIFFTAGAVLLAAAVNMGMLVIGRLVLGLGVGVGTTVGPVYLSEIAPPKLRGTLNVIFQLLITIGILAAGLINLGAQYIHPWGWRLSLGIAGVPGIIIFLAGLVLPDSPSSLAERGRFDKARHVLERCRGVQNVDIEYEDIMEAARQSNLIKSPYYNILKRKYRPQLIIACIFMIFQQFDGINAIIFYAPVLFEGIAGGSTGALLNTVVVNLVNVFATFGAIAFVDRLGRRNMLLIASVHMFVTQIIVAGLLGAEFEKFGSGLPQSISIAILIICIYICGHAYGWGPIGWLYPCEIQPLETRAAGSAINVSSNMLFTFVIGQSFTTMLCSMRYGVFLFFAGCLVIAGLVVYFFFPETTGIPVETTHTVFRDHWFWPKAYPEILTVHEADIPPPAKTTAPAEDRANAKV
ncbi:general substrate transporter [Coccomyxa subellipsoidea C-169]|uniref:General substrate transporter n=1 Tax=Coccomyxa subellipsoidea (strain C-169) TaxID=574566 RepID=I0YVF2_COCSC|nr:general substrate transporter [Coccomyxa subellipsoidea C-169]EIE22371.1 general substrate transporter [Coccomyxa subellipsoidea C-169]|eukprot:XP_005646915.1 general substrate transporter [Coccomyxa subellipsoidea C-169]